MTRIVTTGRLSDGVADSLPHWRRMPLNFEPALAPVYLRTDEWVEDHHVQPLPPESPGRPEESASFAVARRLVRDYVFVDPAIVRGVWDADEPLLGRTIVLEGRFYGLRFPMGLRVGGVLDETVDVGGRTCTRWGWNYGTLQGHLERGQMDFEVRKWHDTGEIEFRIDAYSSQSDDPNPVVRFGLHVFGRWMQGRYSRRAQARMLRLVRAEVADTARRRA